MPGGNLAVQIRCALGSKACFPHKVQIMTNSAADVAFCILRYYQLCLIFEFCQYLLHESDSQLANLTGHMRVGESDSMRPTTTYQQEVILVSFRQCEVPGSALCTYCCRMSRQRSG